MTMRGRREREREREEVDEEVGGKRMKMIEGRESRERWRR